MGPCGVEAEDDVLRAVQASVEARQRIQPRSHLQERSRSFIPVLLQGVRSPYRLISPARIAASMADPEDCMVNSRYSRRDRRGSE